MMSPTTMRSSFLCLSLLAIAGCGGSSLPTDPGDSVLVADATAFSVSSLGGGFGTPQMPPGASCNAGVWTYTVHLDTSTFDWDTCDVTGDATDPASYTHAAGSRPLSSSELATARSSGRAVHVSGQDLCGADKPSMFMTVTSPAGSIVYGDDFYACAKTYDHYVNSDEISALGIDLHELDTH